MRGAEFLANPGQPGWRGAILDEYARAAADLCDVVDAVSPARFVAAKPSPDPDCVSIERICAHMLRAAKGYANYIRERAGMPLREPFSEPVATLANPTDFRPRLVEALRYTDETLEPLASMKDEELVAMTFQVRWGPMYDPEMIMEHAICHLLRHRRQIERW